MKRDQQVSQNAMVYCGGCGTRLTMAQIQSMDKHFGKGGNWSTTCRSCGKTLGDPPPVKPGRKRRPK